MSLLLGLAVLALIVWGVSVLARSNPKALAQGMRVAGGIVALAGAAFLTARGQVGLALPLGIAGLSLLGWLPFGPAGMSSRTNKSAGRVSRVRSRFVEMELDHDSGDMDGRLVAGRAEGSRLDALSLTELLALLPDFDEESRNLLAAYLDRRHPDWRDHAQDDTAARGGGAPGHGPMAEEEAYQILGLQPGASEEDITRAHRTLMKRFHPDQGGSNYLAALVNEAKDVLLRRHR